MRLFLTVLLLAFISNCRTRESKLKGSVNPNEDFNEPLKGLWYKDVPKEKIDTFIELLEKYKQDLSPNAVKRGDGSSNEKLVISYFGKSLYFDQDEIAKVQIFKYSDAASAKPSVVIRLKNGGTVIAMDDPINDVIENATKTSLPIEYFDISYLEYDKRTRAIHYLSLLQQKLGEYKSSNREARVFFRKYDKDYSMKISDKDWWFSLSKEQFSDLLNFIGISLSDGFFRKLFIEIKQAQGNSKPVTLGLLKNVELATKTVHTFFNAMYPNIGKGVFSKLMSFKDPAESINFIKGTIEDPEGKNSIDNAIAMGIFPDSAWAGGGEKNWQRYVPSEALNPANWNVFTDSEANQKLVVADLKPRPKTSYFFLGRRISKIEPEFWAVDQTENVARTVVIIAEGDIELYSRYSIENCVIIAAGSVTLNSETTFCTIIAAGSVIFKNKMVSTVVVSDKLISGKLAGMEGIMSFAKGHFLAESMLLEIEETPATGIYKNYFIKNLYSEYPYDLLDEIAKELQVNEKAGVKIK